MTLADRIKKIEEAIIKVISIETLVVKFKLNIEPDNYVTIALEIVVKDKEGNYLFCGSTETSMVIDVIKKLEEDLK